MSRQKCRLCGSEDQDQAFHFSNHNIVHHLLDLKDSKPRFRGDFKLIECNQCGFLYSPDYFCKREELYDNYITLSSAKDDNHAEDIIRRIKQFTGKESGSLCEVGCNDGKFLKRLDRTWFTHISAIEPAKDAFNKAIDAHSAVINDFFTFKTAQKYYKMDEFDCVVTRQVLEHICDLDDFMQGVNWILNDDGLLVIEVPDHSMNYELLDYSFWEEHINYFTLNTLRQLLRKHGFFIYHHETILFSGKALIVYCKKYNFGSFKAHDYDLGIRKSYINKFKAIKHGVQEFIATKAKEFDSIVIYGAGCRALCTASFLELSSYIEYFVDDSPEKYGKYVPGSRLEIINSSELEKIERTFFLLGVNAEVEHKIINKIGLSPKNYASILPPSPHIPEFWISKAVE